MLGIATAVGSLARFIGPILIGFLYDLAQARGAFFGGAILTGAAFALSLWMRQIPLMTEAEA
jgi:MFS family permease